MKKKKNRNSSAGTAADSGIKPTVNLSADIEANPMLCEVRLYKEYFKFPLKRQYSKVFTDDYGMALDFVLPMMVENAFKISDDDKDNVVRILNGEKATMGVKLNLEYKGGTIYANGQEFMWVRSWGRLTGIGGYNLPSEKASAIQDDFAKYVIDTLNECQR